MMHAKLKISWSEQKEKPQATPAREKKQNQAQC